jgi:hypothetical protein
VGGALGSVRLRVVFVAVVGGAAGAGESSFGRGPTTVFDRMHSRVLTTLRHSNTRLQDSVSACTVSFKSPSDLCKCVHSIIERES